MSVTRVLFGVLLAGAVVHGSGSWQVDGGDVVVVCPLTVGGSFEAKTRSLSGSLTAGDGGSFEGALTVDLSSLDTGIGLRNTHLRERYLEVQRGEGFSHARLTEVVLESAGAAVDGGGSGFTASFTVHGVTRPVRGTATLTRRGEGMRVEAAFPVSLPAHEIPKPRYLGVGVRDDVEVRVAFTAASGSGTGQE